LRSYVAPEFLVYGEMIRPGTIADEQNEFFEFDYEYFFAIGASSTRLFSDPWGDKVPAKAHQLEHRGKWKARPLLTNAWSNIDPLVHRTPGPGAGPFLPAALYAILNSSNETRAFRFKVDTDVFGSASCAWEWLRMKPDHEDSWDQWNRSGVVLLPLEGWIRHSWQLTLGAHEAYLLKIAPRGT
jgi:hypothetical protein